MRLKPGVSLRGVKPQVAIGLLIADGVLRKAGADLIVSKIEDPVCTSVTDGAHKTGSLHYRGLAFDLRTRDFPSSDGLILNVAETLRAALGHEWDVIVEADHIHCEWDAREA